MVISISDKQSQTGSGSDRVSLNSKVICRVALTRSLPLPVLNSSTHNEEALQHAPL